MKGFQCIYPPHLVIKKVPRIKVEKNPNTVKSPYIDRLYIALDNMYPVTQFSYFIQKKTYAVDTH